MLLLSQQPHLLPKLFFLHHKDLNFLPFASYSVKCNFLLMFCARRLEVLVQVFQFLLGESALLIGLVIKSEVVIVVAYAQVLRGHIS